MTTSFRHSIHNSQVNRYPCRLSNNSTSNNNSKVKRLFSTRNEIQIPVFIPKLHNGHKVISHSQLCQKLMKKKLFCESTDSTDIGFVWKTLKLEILSHFSNNLHELEFNSKQHYDTFTLLVKRKHHPISMIDEISNLSDLNLFALQKGFSRDDAITIGEIFPYKIIIKLLSLLNYRGFQPMFYKNPKYHYITDHYSSRMNVKYLHDINVEFRLPSFKGNGNDMETNTLTYQLEDTNIKPDLIFVISYIVKDNHGQNLDLKLIQQNEIGGSDSDSVVNSDIEIENDMSKEDDKEYKDQHYEIISKLKQLLEEVKTCNGINASYYLSKFSSQLKHKAGALCEIRCNRM